MGLPRIQHIFIKWETEKGGVLIISLGHSGSINRTGDGTLIFPPSHMHMGKDDQGIFSALIDALQEEWFELAGRYHFPGIGSQYHKLTLQFTGEELDTGFEFTFGEDTEGPPEDILQFVELAISLTDPWYEEKLLAKQQRKK